MKIEIIEEPIRFHLHGINGDVVVPRYFTFPDLQGTTTHAAENPKDGWLRPRTRSIVKSIIWSYESFFHVIGYLVDQIGHSPVIAAIPTTLKLMIHGADGEWSKTSTSLTSRKFISSSSVTAPTDSPRSSRTSMRQETAR